MHDSQLEHGLDMQTISAVRARTHSFLVVRPGRTPLEFRQEIVIEVEVAGRACDLLHHGRAACSLAGGCMAVDLAAANTGG